MTDGTSPGAPPPGGAQRTAALPFTLRRSHDVFGTLEMTSTRETVHGLLHLDGERLVIQWRVARETDRMGREIRTDRELEPVREVVVPLACVAAAHVRRPWWPRPPRIVLTASDLRAFEEVAGAGGLRMDHPAELVLSVRRADDFAARAFAGEVQMAVAERALRAAEALADPDAGPPAIGPERGSLSAAREGPP